MIDQQHPIYAPDRRFDFESHDIAYIDTPQETWMATVHQPLGQGPFPALLYVHGGAWSGGDRNDRTYVNAALASSGLVVVSIDFRIAPEHPYPAQVADTNFAIRWLKAHAEEFRVHPQAIGGTGQSSGGHTVMLAALRPRDEQYGARPLSEAPDMDASLAFLILRYPVLDPQARYSYAKETGRERLVTATEGYFLTEAGVKVGSAQDMVDRGDADELPPTLILQGTVDGNIPNAIPERFIHSYRRAGGTIDLQWLEDAPHGFDREPGWHTSRALSLMRAFVVEQLNSAAVA
jgi:acetyl esterase/lipase